MKKLVKRIAIILAVSLAASQSPVIASGDVANYSAALTNPGSLGPDLQATWAPDSKTVYFIRHNRGDWKIYKQVIGSSSATFVTYGMEPSISPDGKYMAYWPEPDRSQTIEIMNLSTKRMVTDISVDTGLSHTRMSTWSPDGQYLYFSGSATDNGSDFDLYRYRISDRTFSKITNNLGIVGNLSISPNGESAIGYAFGGINGEQTSATIELQNGAVQALSACGNAYPAPIARSTDFLCAIPQSSGSSLQRNSSSGSRVSIIDTASSDPQASVSPNGSFVVYNKYNRATRNDVIWLQALDGSTPSKVVSPRNGISINTSEIATNSESVTISVVAPEWADEITISNDGSFSNASTFPVDADLIPWDLDAYSGATTTRIVYVRFGSDLTYTDSIIVDKTKPTVSSFSKGTTTTAAASFHPVSTVSRGFVGGVRKATIKASITEKGSGLAQVEYNSQANSEGSTLTAFTASASSKKISKSFTIRVPKNLKVGYFRVKDKAGNWSSWKKVNL
jgi:hypothetical protein